MADHSKIKEQQRSQEWHAYWPKVFLDPKLIEYEDSPQGRLNAAADAYVAFGILCNSQKNDLPVKYGQGMVKISKALGFSVTAENLDENYQKLINKANKE